MPEEQTITAEAEAPAVDPNLAVIASLDTDDPEPSSADTEPASEADSEPKGPSKADLDKAVAALKRASVPKTQIDGMLKNDPDGLLEWGQKAAEHQRATDGYGTKIETLEAKLAKAELKLKDTEPGQPDSEPGELQKLIEAIKDDYGEELATPLGKLMEHVEKSLTKQSESAQERLAALEDAQLSAIQRAARPDLLSKFPQTEDDSNWSEVCDLAKKFTESGISKSPDTALSDAAKHLFADELMEAKAGHKRTISKAKSNGQPTSSAKTHTERPANMDLKQQGMAVLGKLEEGASVEEVKKWRERQN